MKKIFTELEIIEMPRVTGIIAEMGFYDFSRVNPAVLEFAKNRGTMAHKATELDDKGILNAEMLDNQLKPYLQAWKQYKADYGVQVVFAELPVWSKLGFRGTLDRICQIGDKIAIVDIKCTAKINPATAIQTAGYQLAYEERTGTKIDYRICCQLLKNGNYNLAVYKENSKDKAIFLACLTVFNFKKTLKDKKNDK